VNLSHTAIGFSIYDTQSSNPGKQSMRLRLYRNLNKLLSIERGNEKGSYLSLRYVGAYNQLDPPSIHPSVHPSIRPSVHSIHPLADGWLSIQEEVRENERGKEGEGAYVRACTNNHNRSGRQMHAEGHVCLASLLGVSVMRYLLLIDKRWMTVWESPRPNNSN